jgi:hypothetical protein
VVLKVHRSSRAINLKYLFFISVSKNMPPRLFPCLHQKPHHTVPQCCVAGVVIFALRFLHCHNNISTFFLHGNVMAMDLYHDKKITNLSLVALQTLAYLLV